MRRIAVLFIAGVLLLPGPTHGDDPPSPYLTAGLKRGPVLVRVTATGSVAPVLAVDVGTQISGAIKSFAPDPKRKNKTIDFNSEVKAGQVLVELDAYSYEVEVEKAKAELERRQGEEKLAQARLALAEKELQRAVTLNEKKAIFAEELDVSKCSVEVARAAAMAAQLGVKAGRVALEHHERSLGLTKIRSPIDGVIIDRRVNVGQRVGPDQQSSSLFLIASDLRKLEVWVSIPEAEMGRVKKEQKAQISVSAFPNDRFSGIVTSIHLNAASLTRAGTSYTVLVALDNLDGRILPYMTAQADIEVAQRKDALLVPNRALQWLPRSEQIAAGQWAAYMKWLKDKHGEDEALVWLPEKEFVRPVRVKLGAKDGELTEILSGDVKEGMAVVIGPGGRKPD